MSQNGFPLGLCVSCLASLQNFSCATFVVGYDLKFTAIKLLKSSLIPKLVKAYQWRTVLEFCGARRCATKSMLPKYEFRGARTHTSQKVTFLWGTRHACTTAVVRHIYFLNFKENGGHRYGAAGISPNIFLKFSGGRRRWVGGWGVWSRRRRRRRRRSRKPAVSGGWLCG
jgi:hypothetical protein